MAEVDKNKQLKPIDEVKRSLVLMQAQFSMVLPPHIPVEKFCRVIVTALQLNPKLMECDRTSLYAEAMKCATDGLIADGREAALVPYKGLVKYLPMVGGILKKIRNSGELETITAQVVYENDVFDYELGDNERIVHKPCLDGDRGARQFVYAIAKIKDGGVYREVMTKEHVMAVKSCSKQPDGLMWTTFEDEGWRKSVLHRISKRLPMSTDIEQLIHRDDDMYDLNKVPAKPTVGKSRASRLQTVIDAQVETVPAETEPPAAENATPATTPPETLV